MTSLRGQLLVAVPPLLDPNFRRTVVLVTEHGADGAMGLVLNRPSPTTVAEAVPDLACLVPEGAPVLLGGPVQPTVVLGLAEYEDPGDAPALVLGDVGLLPPEPDLERLPEITRRARVFAGYAGWAAGQLDAEVDAEGWIVEPARADDVFAPDPDTLWGSVLARKGGQYALLARMPLDPSVN